MCLPGTNPFSTLLSMLPKPDRQSLNDDEKGMIVPFPLPLCRRLYFHAMDGLIMCRGEHRWQGMVGTDLGLELTVLKVGVGRPWYPVFSMLECRGWSCGDGQRSSVFGKSSVCVVVCTLSNVSVSSRSMAEVARRSEVDR